MKVSEVLQQALDNHYCNGTEFHEGKCEFMCHAVHYAFAKMGFNSITRIDAPCFFETKKVIEKSLCGEFTLHGQLVNTNERYRYLRNRYHSDTPACYKMRRQFWVDLIAKLVAEGK